MSLLITIVIALMIGQKFTYIAIAGAHILIKIRVLGMSEKVEHSLCALTHFIASEIGIPKIP